MFVIETFGWVSVTWKLWSIFVRRLRAKCKTSWTHQQANAIQTEKWWRRRRLGPCKPKVISPFRILWIIRLSFLCSSIRQPMIHRSTRPMQIYCACHSWCLRQKNASSMRTSENVVQTNSITTDNWVQPIAATKKQNFTQKQWICCNYF